MRAAGIWLARVMLALAGLAALIWAFGPREGVGQMPSFHLHDIGPDLDVWLATREAVFDDLTPGTEKRVLWAGAANARTPLALVYIHGFSATSEELRPVPDRVAAALGANLYFARLAGHGRDGAALGAATADDWLFDLAEALAIGRRIGERVVVIGTSTGGTLAALAAVEPGLSEAVAGLVLVSPNFGLADRTAQTLLDLPWARHWGPALVGADRSFQPLNAAQERYWTWRYPTVAVMPVATLVRHAKARDFGAARVPALIVYSEADRVVAPRATQRVAARWGAPAAVVTVTPGPGDDPFAHVVAGDILSPGLTDTLVATVRDWIIETAGHD